MHLIEQKSEFVLQKSTNSGTSYTDIKKAKNNLSQTVYLNQNDLIRITSDSTNKLTFNQGDLNNSFGAHLLNSGNSTSPIPIYGFFVDKNGAQTSLGAHGTIVNWHKVSNQHFILPEANFDLTNGIYTIPVRIFTSLLIFPTVYTQTLFRDLARKFIHSNKKELK